MGFGSRWAAVILLSLSAVPAMAQTGAGKKADPPQGQTMPTLSQRPAPQVSAPEGKVQLDVLVTDASGSPVSGLEQSDFTLLDNQQPRPIISFRAFPRPQGEAPALHADPPVEVILLVDFANTSLQRVAYTRIQVENYLRKQGAHLAQPTSLMLFFDQGVKVLPQSSTDGNAMADALDHSSTAVHTIPLAGGYDAIERMSLSLKSLNQIAAVEGRKPGRKMLLWIGSGWPMLDSSVYQLSVANRQSLFNDIVESSRTLREARITLYSLHLIEPGSSDQLLAQRYLDFLKPVLSPKQLGAGNLSLPVLAVHSGGRSFATVGDLPSEIASCYQEASAYYTLSFDPPSIEHVDEYHELRVEIDKPSMTARTNAGYYAEPLPKP